MTLGNVKKRLKTQNCMDLFSATGHTCYSSFLLFLLKVFQIYYAKPKSDINNSFRIIFIKIFIIIKVNFIERSTLEIPISLAANVALLKSSSKNSILSLVN